MPPHSSGSVRVGEADLADLDPDAWRAQLAWVPQRPHLFARSIADNVRLGRPDATDDQVRAAITDAGLDDVVARLPDGIRTPLGHDGAGLSAGERQRVALARAFVRDAPLLLLDEPTANLDGRTEQAVLAAVRRLMAGRTVVIVAHRPVLAGAGRPGGPPGAGGGDGGGLMTSDRDGPTSVDRQRGPVAPDPGPGPTGIAVGWRWRPFWPPARWPPISDSSAPRRGSSRGRPSTPTRLRWPWPSSPCSSSGCPAGFFRYGERLVGHDAAFRLLADLRVQVYERLERLAPAGLPSFRRGDLLARIVRDVDSQQDLVIRVIPPFGTAVRGRCR